MMRNAFTVVLAAACLAVLATRVPLEFSRIRVRAATAPRAALADSSVTVNLPDVSRLAGSPSAIIVRLRGGAEQARLTLALDGERLTEVVVPPLEEIRVDASTTISKADEHRLVVSGDRPGWQLTYLEIANVHGYSRGIFGFTIVPHDLLDMWLVPWWLSIPVVGGLLALRPRPDWPAHARLRRLYHAGIAAVLALFAVVLVIDRFSPYKVLLSPSAFLMCLAVLYAEYTFQALRGGASLLRSLDRFRRRHTPAFLAACRRAAAAVSTAFALQWLPVALVVSAAVTVTGTALAVGTHAAGGADSYGYVSQAALWATGRLYVDQPLVRELPNYTDASFITPLGWVGQPGAGVPGRIVPSYSPGLPMVMAPFQRALGPDGIYLVVPILLGLTVWLTFVLGRHLDGDSTGLFAAVWLASSPAVVGSAFSPMSDVPVTAWWLAAIVGALRPGAGPAALAGIASSLAVLTRPNLAPLNVVVLLPYVYRLAADRQARRLGARNLFIFLATAAIGPVIVAVLFNYWYGSPFKSGYGSTSDLFSWTYLTTNLARYPRWLIESQTVLILAGLVTPALLPRRTDAPRLPPRAIAWMLVAMCVMVWVAYMTYFPFDNWGYLRFLLPSYPPLIVLSSAAFATVLRRTKAPRLLGMLLIALIVVAGVAFGKREEIFTMYQGETRYVRVAEFVAMRLPERALLMSMQHSGSLRYYSGRTTLRYDLLRPDRLDHIVEYFAARGYPVYFVLDGWEETEFRARYAKVSALGKLDWKPLAKLSGVNPLVIYDPRERDPDRQRPTRLIP